MTEAVLIFSHLPIVVTTVFALLIYKRAAKEIRVFSVFLVVSCIIQMTSLVLGLCRINNLPLLHLYVLLGFLSLGYFYNTVLEGFIDKRILKIVMALFGLFTVFNSLFIQPLHTFNSIALTVESLLVLIFSLSTYLFLLNQIVQEKRREIIVSINWINSGLLIYYFSSLFLFYFGEAIMRSFSKNFSRHTWVIHSLFSVIMYVCFFIGIWKRPKS